MPFHAPRYGDQSHAVKARGVLPEELERQGFAILPAVLDAGQLERCRRLMDEHHVLQTQRPDAAELAAVGELDIVRAPLVQDDFFLFAVAMAPPVYDLARAIIGDYCLLHLQNAIINQPERPHHQSAWHRDLPYLNRTSSSPLAISALFCVDEFSIETGATLVLPGSHRTSQPPSDADLTQYARPVAARAGDVIVFDSMLVHRAGANHSSLPRRAVNNVYSVGIIRQQIDLPRALEGRHSEEAQRAVLLGYTSNAPDSAEAYRRSRLDRLDPK